MNKIFAYRDEDGLMATVDHRFPPLERSLKIWNHSPSGFEIGYGGSGPAQLALAILMMFTDDKTASRLHQDFKWEFLARSKYREMDVITIEVDIPEWIKSKVEQE